MVHSHPMGRPNIKEKSHYQMSPCRPQRSGIQIPGLGSNGFSRCFSIVILQKILTLSYFLIRFLCRKYPKINLKLRAPLELENLLPYNLEYRIYDKNTNQNWRSYLRKGGVMPVHSVELGHFVLLNVTVEDTGQHIFTLPDLDSN